jgi:hypothetical protein
MAMVIALIVSLASGSVAGAMLAQNNVAEANNSEEESQLQVNEANDLSSPEDTYAVSETQNLRPHRKRKLRMRYVIPRYTRAYKFGEIH